MPTRLATAPFYFVRHGETDWNLQDRLQGWVDIPLNETGRTQARAAAAALSASPITSICASPLDRALETATIIQETLGVPLEVIDELKEVGCGENEGRQKKHWDTRTDTDWRDGKSKPVGGESFSEFLERILTGVEISLNKPGPVLIVSHGQVFRTLIQSIRAHLDEHTPNGIPMYLEPISEGRGGWALYVMRDTD